jgi:hypothetical protein
MLNRIVEESYPMTQNASSQTSQAVEEPRSPLVQTIARELAAELTQGLDRIRHCIGQLSDEQLWWRPSEHMNSIGNLMLHLAGNLRQWIVCGVGGAKDVRRRQQEFDERGPIPETELWKKLESTVAEASAALAVPSVDDWQRVRRIQGFEVTGFAAALHSVAHFRGHQQEIVNLTRTQLGQNYRFAFVPQTREQGAG